MPGMLPPIYAQNMNVYLRLHYLRQLGSRFRVIYLVSMPGMQLVPQVIYDRTSTYDGIMLKFRKKVSMLITTSLPCSTKLGGVSILTMRCQEKGIY